MAVVDCQTPVLAVVGNDACWSQIARDQIRILGRGTACDLAVCSSQNSCQHSVLLISAVVQCNMSVGVDVHIFICTVKLYMHC